MIMDVTKQTLVQTNARLTGLSVPERIKWAFDTYRDGLYAMTSAGVDSAVMLQQIAEAGVSIPVIHINTGFLAPETLDFRDSLQRRYGFRLHEIGPSQEQIADIEELRLWEGDLELYSKLTKLDPLTKAVKELKVTALLVGIRGDQTANRAGLGFVGRGHDGEVRIHPLIDWDKTRIEHYIQQHNLPRNPLYYQGYESIGDRHLTAPGADRSGRTVMECGLHVTNGKAQRQSAKSNKPAA
jgi:phosphoadenosine phosphosulfate reductase